MPTYGYRCPKCTLEFDVWQRMTDEPEAECPTCGTAARRLFFPAGIVFKGAGFYKTDSRKSTSDSASTTSASDGSASKTKTDAGSKAASTSTPASPD